MRKTKFKVVRKGELASNYVSCFAEGRYQRTYNNDEIVEAEPGSLGIMVFGKRSQAKKFVESRMSFMRNLLHIKHVLPIGNGKRPPFVSRRTHQENIHEFYQRYAHFKREWITVPLKNSPLNTPPEGTICYPAVKVLD